MIHFSGVVVVNMLYSASQEREKWQVRRVRRSKRTDSVFDLVPAVAVGGRGVTTGKVGVVRV